jgi:hypothetical protein
MYFLLVHGVISVIALIVAVYDIAVDIKKSEKFIMDYAYILIIIASFVPILNIVFIVLSLFDEIPEYLGKRRPIKEKKNKEKNLKKEFEKNAKQNKIRLQKNPSLGVVQTLSKILKIYTQEFTNEMRFSDSLNVLKNINQYVVDNQEKPEIVKLLMEYELTLTRMLTIVEDGLGSDKESYYEVISVANDTIYMFDAEVQKIKDDEYELEKTVIGKTKERRIQELREDQEFHKKRTASIS